MKATRARTVANPLASMRVPVSFFMPHLPPDKDHLPCSMLYEGRALRFKGQCGGAWHPRRTSPPTHAPSLFSPSH